MRKLFCSLIALSSLVCTVNAQISSKGLVASYSFTGNAKDESGSGNNGVVHGATLTFDRFGNPNCAYNFDGISNYIEIVPKVLSGLNEYTYSLWAKPKGIPTNGGGMMLSVGDIQTNSDQGLTYQPTKTYFAGSYNAGSNPIQSYAKSTVIAPDQWMHVVVTRNSDSIKLFINGDLVKLDSYTLINKQAVSQGTNAQALILGGRCSLYPDYFFKGAIDDLRFYNRALSDNEVTALSLEIKNRCSINVSDTLLLHSRLVAYNPITYLNNIKVYPNQAKNKLIIDFGADFSSMRGYSLKIVNKEGVSTYNATIDKQSEAIDLLTWDTKETYTISLINEKGNTLDYKVILLQAKKTTTK